MDDIRIGAPTRGYFNTRDKYAPASELEKKVLEPPEAT
jgi:hypothetical protein